MKGYFDLRVIYGRLYQGTLWVRLWNDRGFYVKSKTHSTLNFSERNNKVFNIFGFYITKLTLNKK